MRNVKQQAVAWVVCATFSAQLLGCASGPMEIVEEQGDRRVSTQLVGQVRDPETGEVEEFALEKDEFTLGDYAWQDRELVIDGETTTDITRIYEGTEIVVPLRRGGAITLRRDGDQFAFLNVDVEGTTEQPALRGVRLGADTVEVLGQEVTPDARLLIRVGGIDDLPEARRALVAALGLDVLLATVEESDTVAPAVIAAAVAAIVGAAWMAACGVTLYACIRRCKEEFHVTCGAIKVKVDWPRIDTDLSIGFGCSCR